MKIKANKQNKVAQFKFDSNNIHNNTDTLKYNNNFLQKNFE